MFFTVCFLLFTQAGALERQTDIHRAGHQFDEDGMFYMEVEGVGKVRHPAWVALYALQYAGIKTYQEEFKTETDLNKFRAQINWLLENMKRTDNGDLVWLYEFDNTYNDISIHAPWFSAFGQAVIIEALLASYKIDKNDQHLELAKEAAEVLLRPVKSGGLLFQKDEDIWFEEIPVPTDNPPHILNGHMRVLIALKELFLVSKDKRYEQWFKKGVDTLKKWLHLYDTGYWLRYDLNAKKKELLFRFTNPYGFMQDNLPIDYIKLVDPVSKEIVMLDVGAEGDAIGAMRIAGNDWQQSENLEGHTVRRLQPVISINPHHDKKSVPDSPGTFFYLELPSSWSDNLRTEGYILEIGYYDGKIANVSCQIRSISPGQKFRNLRDGYLLLTGENKWRKWKIRLQSTDLGYWTGKLYGKKHYDYLNILSQYDSKLIPWRDLSRGYLTLTDPFDGEKERMIVPLKQTLPDQTPMVPLYFLDKEGVVLQYYPSNETVFNNGFYDFLSPPGKGIYSPFVIALQALKGKKHDWNPVGTKRLLDNMPEYKEKYSLIDDNSMVNKSPAFRWFEKNKKRIHDSYVWLYPFSNSYNDVTQKSDWQSSFSQRYIIDAFLSRDDYRMAEKAANAYLYDTSEGGVSTFNKEMLPWYEEVPNNTHVANAHLSSLNSLIPLARKLENRRLINNAQDGLRNLIDNNYLFDTNYWYRYDLNPKKEFLIQIDWLNGEESPAIESIYLQDPVTGLFTFSAVESIEGSLSRFTGIEWNGIKVLEGRKIRTFKNGYKLHETNVEGGGRHNVYFHVVLPDMAEVDLFDILPYRLVIRYKDMSKGRFCIKTQAINEGNVLSFKAIENGVWSCNGDGEWKDAVFFIRPQDLGWYVGPGYQKYIYEQFKELADKTDNWFIKQVAQKQRFVYEAKMNNQTIVQDAPSLD